VIGHIEELQLITLCDNWENVEARALYTMRVCVVKSNLIAEFQI